MAVQTVANLKPPRGGDVAQVAAAALDSLAARFRSGGLVLAMLRPDARLTWHDAAAGVFFQRYVLPLLQYRDAANEQFRTKIAAMSASSTLSVWRDLPGVILAVFPYLEKRQLAGIMVLAAKATTFKLGEDVVRVCSQLGLDGIWLNQQAEDL